MGIRVEMGKEMGMADSRCWDRLRIVDIEVEVLVVL